MATLAALVAQLPEMYRARYDFTNFWIPKANEVIKLIVQNVDLPECTREVGVDVLNSFWITLPNLCRRVIEIISPISANQGRTYPFSFVEGKIKLRDAFTRYGSVANKTISWQSTSVVNVTDTGTNAIQYENGLLVLTNGDGVESGVSNTHIVATAINGGASLVVATLLHSLSAAYSTSTTAYLLPASYYLLVRGVYDFTEITSSLTEVPLSNKFEKAIVTGLRIKIMEEIEDVQLLNQWIQMFQFELGLLKIDSGKAEKLRQQLLGIQESAKK